MKRKSREHVAIVGGGITGLFCALALQKENVPFTLYESSDRLGGRIRTVRIRKDGSTWDDFAEESDHADVRNELDFYAEFGPMRVECELQHLLKALLTTLGITRSKTGKDRKWKPHLVDFPAYSSPTSSRDPKYSMPRSEDGKSPLELLTLALMRIMYTVGVSGNSQIARKLEKWRKAMDEAGTDFEKQQLAFMPWLEELNDRDCWEFQTTAQWIESPFSNRTPTQLCHIGFWNIIADVLDHTSIMKMRDLGTFYHLLPDNPNAAEWIIWWLKGLCYGNKLQGIHGGMECIVELMVRRIGEKNLLTDHAVTSLSKETGKWRLTFADGRTSLPHTRVILALPIRPLTALIGNSREAFLAVEPRIDELVDSAFGFPMVKVFAVVDRRWWPAPRPANQFATDIPTRELHYWDGMTRGSTSGMVMAYTDRPATSFWSNYVPPGHQYDVTGHGRTSADSRLKHKILHYIRRGGGRDVASGSIAWYGIRDWGRDPYGAGNHAWRPERRFWVVMRRLADLDSSYDQSVHICGEAYSDYHGFIEGSLRSAVYSLHRIFQRYGQSELQWLPSLLRNKLARQHFAELVEWKNHLDAIPVDSEFIVRE
jgi:monoamine oxidase